MIKKRRNLKLIIIVLALLQYPLIYTTTPLYFCTGATEHYFKHLLNLIGSIHKVNFNELAEIAVFDLGMTTEQIEHLNHIEKLTIHSVKKTHPDILTFFPIPGTRPVLGWFAWKIVVIKQALDLFPYVLWLDAGTTVLKPLDVLFKYIQQQGYFLSTIGDELNSFGKPRHSVEWGLTTYVSTAFNLRTPQNCWILDQEPVMGGVIGIAQHAAHAFLMPIYKLTYDLRNFQDDGSAQNGIGTARHDQSLLSIFAYSKCLTVFKQDYTQHTPMLLTVDNQHIPLYITWHRHYICDKTHIYNSRSDLSKIDYYTSYIHYKKGS